VLPTMAVSARVIAPTDLSGIGGSITSWRLTINGDDTPPIMPTTGDDGGKYLLRAGVVTHAAANDVRVKITGPSGSVSSDAVTLDGYADGGWCGLVRQRLHDLLQIVGVTYRGKPVSVLEDRFGRPASVKAMPALARGKFPLVVVGAVSSVPTDERDGTEHWARIVPVPIMVYSAQEDHDRAAGEVGGVCDAVKAALDQSVDLFVLEGIGNLDGASAYDGGGEIDRSPDGQLAVGMFRVMVPILVGRGCAW
jgi:hypothetical protein